MDGMTKEQFKRKYEDTHTEIKCMSDLEAGRANSSLIKKSPGDKNIKTRGKIPGKKLIERRAIEQRSDDFKHYILDAVSVRKQEILDKKDVPMVQLLQIVSRNLPQKIESKNEHTFTFADMVKRASAEIIDVEATVE